MKKVLILTVIAILALGVMAMATSFENATPAEFNTSVTIEVAGWGEASVATSTVEIYDWQTFDHDLAATLTVQSNNSTAEVQMFYMGDDLDTYDLGLVFNTTSYTSADAIPHEADGTTWNSVSDALDKTATLAAKSNNTYGYTKDFPINVVIKSNTSSARQNLANYSANKTGTHSITIYFRVSAGLTL